MRQPYVHAQHANPVVWRFHAHMVIRAGASVVTFSQRQLSLHYRMVKQRSLQSYVHAQYVTVL